MNSLSDRSSVVRPASIVSAERPDWRRVLAEAIRDPYELCELLGLPDRIAAQAATHGFKLIAPMPFVRRMKQGDPDDPLLRQVLPTPQEEHDSVELPLDAVGDLHAKRQPGLIHKYRGRALLIAAGDCAVNCRYCFRRHFPYELAPRSQAAWQPAIQAIASDPTVEEVILSGGDPLVNSDRRIERLITELSGIAHVRTLRFHTRLPIVIPQRVTQTLADLLAASRFRSIIVLHTNHANEIDTSVIEAVSRLRDSGSILLNQSVLLRGVNDSASALTALSDRLLDAGVMPYYLHQIDRVAGVSHFEVPIAEGKLLIEQIRQTMPGYAVPRYVREEAGNPSKTVLA